MHLVGSLDLCCCTQTSGTAALDDQSFREEIGLMEECGGLPIQVVHLVRCLEGRRQSRGSLYVLATHS